VVSIRLFIIIILIFTYLFLLFHQHDNCRIERIKEEEINYLNLDFDLMAAYVCPAAPAHDNREACMLCVDRNFECQVMLPKTLARGDISENRVYLLKDHANRFGFTDPGNSEVIVYDDQMNRWRMNLCVRSGENKVYLGKGWRQFVNAKGIREGDTVTFFKFIWRHAGTGPILFKITHEAARREPVLGPFDLNLLPFDLNEPPSPEN
jgi:hypothetical protein